MRALQSNDLSEGIIGLIETFEPHLGSDIEIDAENLLVIVRSLRVMRSIALDMEQELAAHRLGETGREVSDFLETEATQQLVGLVRDPDGKVITPDFRRKP